MGTKLMDATITNIAPKDSDPGTTLITLSTGDVREFSGVVVVDEDGVEQYRITLRGADGTGTDIGPVPTAQQQADLEARSSIHPLFPPMKVPVVVTNTPTAAPTPLPPVTAPAAPPLAAVPHAQSLSIIERGEAEANKLTKYMGHEFIAGINECWNELRKLLGHSHV